MSVRKRYATPLRDASETAAVWQSLGLGDGYQGLWAGVLAKAMEDTTQPALCGSRETRGNVKSEARSWFCRADDQMIGSFAWICMVLDLDISAIRVAVVKRWIEQDSRPPEPPKRGRKPVQGRRVV